jgi:ABC-type spermidine/putrescine transport system permease subunit II
VRLGVNPEINVLATITITVVTLMIVGVAFWMSRNSKLEKSAA